jgi:hypothetical protein
VAVSGPLGIGKTSLLRYVADPAVAERYGLAPPQYVVLYLDVQSVTPFSSERFWRRVARLLARRPEPGLAELAEALLAREAVDVIDLEELLDELGERDRALVLLLDEFEWALQAGSPEAESDSRNFLAQMASLARRAPRSLALVVATELPLPEAMRVIESWRGSPFPTIFTSIALKPLPRAAADRLLDQALAAAGGDVRFHPDDRELLYAFSGGRPAALQAAAFSLFHGRQQGLDGDGLWDAAEAAAEAMMRQARADGAGPQAAAPSGSPAAQSVGEPSTNGPGAAPPPVRAAGDGLSMDAKSGEVYVDGQRVESLTALEYNLLRLLYASPGRLCSKEDIIAQVWGDEFIGEIDDSRVEKLISRLRRKIEPVPGRPQYIRTVRGRGYRFVP